VAEKPESVEIAEIERADGWSPLRMHLDVQAFGINAWTAKEAGDRLISEHDEVPSGHEELYLVVAGRATFTVDGREIAADTGRVVFVADPAVKRAAVAAQPGTTVLAVGGKRGEAYKPRAWETNAVVLPLFERGEFVEAKEQLTAALERYEDQDGLLYNLACASARLGETDEAFDYLRRALVGRPAFAEFARGDDDLEALRSDPRFDELVGEPTG
jgi:tetratricopeptide (TPR) repeat protein